MQLFFDEESALDVAAGSERPQQHIFFFLNDKNKCFTLGVELIHSPVRVGAANPGFLAIQKKKPFLKASNTLLCCIMARAAELSFPFLVFSYRHF
jgi:hypothetical protein